MQTIINKLENIANQSNDRAKHNINNLIDRIKFFDSVGNQEKLNNCIAEAESWGC